ncbi:17841_t:CDS:2 [Cetraspora pellucida]|uniref:17841_t:CDS:1 n=1 Tax=Cetraspora pellucida TaxID=1433469 RepID=A0ACA9LHM4_9GLOM|nr:17841_t:CDS:2 [Cetraspora pellucida]
MSGQDLCILGWRHQFGINIEKNLKKAFECYKQAADLGDGEGMFQMAEFYHLGIYVEMDRNKAFKYFSKSSESRFTMGIHKTRLYYYKTCLYHLDLLYKLDSISQQADEHKPQYLKQYPNHIYISTLINIQEISRKMSTELCL